MLMFEKLNVGDSEFLGYVKGFMYFEVMGESVRGVGMGGFLIIGMMFLVVSDESVKVGMGGLGVVIGLIFCVDKDEYVRGL